MHNIAEKASVLVFSHENQSFLIILAKVTKFYLNLLLKRIYLIFCHELLLGRLKAGFIVFVHYKTSFNSKYQKYPILGII